MGKKLKHGLSSYITHRCRCEECRAAKALYTRLWKARKATAAPMQAVTDAGMLSPEQPHRYHTSHTTWDELVAAAIADPSERIW